jgi:hypothetical protein
LPGRCLDDVGAVLAARWDRAAGKGAGEVYAFPSPRACPKYDKRTCFCRSVAYRTLKAVKEQDDQRQVERARCPPAPAIVPDGAALMRRRQPLYLRHPSANVIFLAADQRAETAFQASRGTGKANRRSPVMDLKEEAIRERLHGALSESDTRLAVLIVQSFKNLLDMLDEQNPQTLEALLDFARGLQKPDSPARKDRYAVRAALIDYVEYALRESRARERRLFYGLTGLPEESSSASAGGTG